MVVLRCVLLSLSHDGELLSIRHIELLTGDNEKTASALADKLSVSYRAYLLPENKIDIVKKYQSKGHVVIMVDDGRSRDGCCHRSGTHCPHARRLEPDT
jgi:hypothetical protein